jgi:hypothetical protein
MTVAAFVVTGVPAWIVGGLAAPGFADLSRRLAGTGRDVASSVAFGVACAALAYPAAGWFTARDPLDPGRRRWLLGALVLAVPGLLGPLVLSFVVLGAFQLPVLRALYDTPVPLALALALLAFPLALVLRVLLEYTREREPLHAARLLVRSASGRVRRAAGRLVWELRSRPRFWIVFLVFAWGYFDMTASKILAPVRMTPVTVILYNEMHYGQNAVLSMKVLVAFGVPLAVLAAAGGARGLVAGLRFRG